MILGMCALVGCATEVDDGNTQTTPGGNTVQPSVDHGTPGQTSTGQISVPVKTTRPYTVGEACDAASYEWFCDGEKVVKCGVDNVVVVVDCGETGATCGLFADLPGIAECMYEGDYESCDAPGTVQKECKFHEYYQDEMMHLTYCTMTSDGNAYIVDRDVYCASDCTKGCQTKSCTGTSSSCSSDGRWLTYCKDGKQYAVDCKRIETYCDPDVNGEADCHDWGDY